MPKLELPTCLYCTNILYLYCTSQNGIREAAAVDKEYLKNHLLTMWQINCRLLLTSITMATYPMNS